MRDSTHKDQIIRWARFVRDNDISVWKPQIKALVDSQIIIANRFYSNLMKEKNGKELVQKLRKTSR